MERDLRVAKRKRDETQKQYDELQKQFSDLHSRYNIAMQLNERIKEMEAKTEKETIPVINKQMLMKKLIAELFGKLGFDNDEAWFHTYLDCQDIEGLAQHM